MTKIEKLETISDQYGNVYGFGFYYPTKSQLIDKINEIIDAVNTLIKTTEEKVDNKNCIKHTDKVEPKFKVGDWITNGLSYPMQISSIEDDIYYTHNDTVGGDIESTDKEYHLWTIQDAKDGDILVAQHNDPFIYKGHFNDLIDSYDGVLYGNQFNVYPATEEQRKLLFQKMKEEGYEFDADKKELKKIK